MALITAKSKASENKDLEPRHATFGRVFFDIALSGSTWHELTLIKRENFKGLTKNGVKVAW